MYVKLADVYDAAYHFMDYEGSAAYIQRAIDAQCPGARSMLELACGTGRYLTLFAPRYAQLEGLDLSGEMLGIARDRAPGVPLHQADMCAFDLGRQFDVVCCLFRSIGYVHTVENLQRAIACMARHTAPGGVVVIEPFFTPETYWVDRVTLNEYKGEDLKVAWMYVSERTPQGARLNTHYLVGRPSGVEHFTEVHDFGLFSREDFARAFALAGLEETYDPIGPKGTGLYVARRCAG